MIDMPPKRTNKGLPRLVRVSMGTAVALGLLESKLDALPTTAYLMTYKRGKCSANCGFCPQASLSRSRADMLSRITWPIFPTRQVLERINLLPENGTIRRVCLQALNYPSVFFHLDALIRRISEQTKIPISVSCQPLVTDNIRRLAEAGAERIGIPLDAATEGLFDKIKGSTAGGPYRWETQFRLLKNAVSVFGEGKVSTHLIVGLGETQREMINTIQDCMNIDVLPALFAFTPIPGTRLEREGPPSIEEYRRVQIARSLILNRLATIEKMHFNREGQLVDFGIDKERLKQIVQSNGPFTTTGCPGCNRPYYNEKPSGPIYNFPRTMTVTELSEVKTQLGLDGA